MFKHTGMFIVTISVNWFEILAECEFVFGPFG